MTREEINKFLADTKVYVAGKSEEIQKKLFALGYEWCDGDTKISDTDSPFLFIYSNMTVSRDCNMTYFSAHINREITAEDILSLELTEPDYRPFKNAEECWQEMLKHQPFAWLKSKKSKSVALIGNVYMNKEVWIVWATNERDVYSASNAFYNYTFADGTPFGIKED